MRSGLGLKDRQRAPQQRKNVLDALGVRPQHPDTWVIRRRVGPDIGKVEIQSAEDSMLARGGSKQSWTRRENVLVIPGFIGLACGRHDQLRITRTPETIQ